MTEPLQTRTWHHHGLLQRTLRVDNTWPGDEVTEVLVRGVADGIGILLNPDQLDEIAGDFHARAALMRGGR